MRVPTQTVLVGLALLAGVLQRISEAAPAAPAAPLAGANPGDPSAPGALAAGLEHVNGIQGAPQESSTSEPEGTAQTDVACRYTGPLPPELAGAKPLAAFRKRVAEIELLVDIDREFEEAERQLDLLRTYATATGEGGRPREGQAEAVVLITTRLAELQLARRAPGRALATLRGVLPMRPLAGLAQDTQFVKSDLATRALEDAWLADPRVVALRERAEAALARRRDGASPVAATPVAEELTDEIWRSMQNGNSELVTAMGSAAVPALRELSLRSITGIDPAAVADQARDPLYWLVRYSHPTALEVILPNLEGTPLIWRKRIVRAMKILGVMNQPRREEGGRKKLDEPRWLDVLDGLVVDPQLWGDVTQLMRFQSQYDDWTPVQAAAVRARLLGDDLAAVRELREDSPWTAVRRDGSIPLAEGMRQLELLEAGLLAPSVEARELASSILRTSEMPLSFLGRLDGATPATEVDFLMACERPGGFRRAFEGPRRDEVLDAAFALAEDPDVEVRRLAAQLLASSKLRDVVEPSRLMVFARDEDLEVRKPLLSHFDASNDQRRPTSAEEFELLRALARDPNLQLRYDAISIVMRDAGPTRLSRAELFALAADEAKDVRSLVPWLPIEDDAVLVEVLKVLALDPEESVVESVDNRVDLILRSDRSKVELLLPVFAARLENRSHPLFVGTEYPQRVATSFLETTGGMQLALAATRRAPDNDGLGSLLRFLQRLRTGGRGLMDACLAVPAPELEFLLYAIGLEEYLPENVNSNFIYRELADHLEAADRPNVGAAMTAASTDPRVSRIVRVYAFGWRMRFEPESSSDALLAFLAEPAWDDYDFGDTESGSALRSLAGAIAPEVRNAVALRVIRTPEIGDYLAETVAEKYFPERPGGVEVSRAMLRRFLTLETTYCRAGAALRHLGGVPGEVEPALLRHALKIENVDSAALGCIAQLKDPQYLPALQECLNPTWIGYHKTRHEFAMETAFAVSQFMTDEASEVLLEGVQIAETEEIRQACFDALERIRLYQEARERIGRREVGKEKRDRSVRELVAMLDDADPGTVAAAVKGLAALGAVDELPALIRLRKHADAGVRAAAEAAVERLTAPVEDGSR